MQNVYQNLDLLVNYFPSEPHIIEIHTNVYTGSSSIVLIRSVWQKIFSWRHVLSFQTYSLQFPLPINLLFKSFWFIALFLGH